MNWPGDDDHDKVTTPARQARSRVVHTRLTGPSARKDRPAKIASG